MELPKELEKVFTKGCEWAEKQEKIILENGVPLTEDQKIDAYLVGVKDIEKVRLLEVNQIPMPNEPELREAMRISDLLSPDTIGITFRYGIYIRKGFWNKRKLIIHELTHTMQYERFGGFAPFLRAYLIECLTVGYPNGPLEQEAIQMEERVSNRN